MHDIPIRDRCTCVSGTHDAGNDTVRCATDAIARRSYGKLVAYLSVHARDVSAAEDALSEAFAAALSDWPVQGTPDHPEAWLLTVARRKAIDMARHQRRGALVKSQLEVIADGAHAALAQEVFPDYRLGLLFACAHPAIDSAIHAPLMLQTVLGLDAKRIASAFLIAPATMGKRLVRAKEKIRLAGIPFQLPEREDLPHRLGAVLDAIYAAFAEGWTDADGTDVVRSDLTGEALFLAQLVAELLPREAEALGLLALLLHAQARRDARRDALGDYVPLAKQDPARWNAAMIDEAEVLLLRASTLGSVGRFQLEAAVQSAHVHGCRCGQTDWPGLVKLYDALSSLTGSPVVAINRALAIAQIDGPDAALASMPTPETDARLAEYQPYWAARAELLARSGAVADALHAYGLAIGLEHDPAVRRFLLRRKQALSGEQPC